MSAQPSLQPSLPRLFSPARIGSLQLANRLVMAPMATDFAEGDGSVSEKLTEYLRARARGGVGLIIAEVCGVDSRHPYTPRGLGLWSDQLVPAYRRLTAAVHAHGAKIVPQIAHPGPDSLAPLLTGLEAVGPSAGVPNTLTRTLCREITAEEIEEAKTLFAEAARRAREAGCDGIELHAAHAYMLVGSFLSALRNRRTDRYGGGPDERLAFALEVLAAIRARVGRDFPVILRVSADELAHGGRGLRETLYIAPKLEAAGVDAFHVSGGSYPALSWRVIPPTGTPLALNSAFSAALKRAVRVPVLLVGRINDPRLAEDVLAREEADLVVMGRALLADPELANKARAGRFGEIAPCVGCGLGCVEAREQGGDMSCLVNPELGREGEGLVQPAARPRAVLVAGAGPAGLAAAWTAARRGHQVSLYEKEHCPGGLYNLAAVGEGKQELARVVKYLAARAESAGVRLVLGREADERTLAEEAPEVLIAATGSEPCAAPPCPASAGAESKLLQAVDVLAGRVPRPFGRVLVAGGGTVGCEAAEMIAAPGFQAAEVWVVEKREEPALDMFHESRVLLLERLRARGVRFLTGACLREISADGAVIERGGAREALSGFDWVVLALGGRPHDPLSAAARARGLEVRVVGDARKPRRALEAVAEGFEAGRTV